MTTLAMNRLHNPPGRPSLAVAKNKADGLATFANNVSYFASIEARAVCVSCYPKFVWDPNNRDYSAQALFIVGMTVIAVSASIFSGARSTVLVPFPDVKSMVKQGAIFTAASIILPLAYCSTTAARVEAIAILTGVTIASVFCHFFTLLTVDVGAERKNKN